MGIIQNFYQAVLDGHYRVIEKVDAFMEKGSCNVPAALLSYEKPLAARLRNITSCSSKFMMNSCYVKIMHFPRHIDIAQVCWTCCFLK